jgi:toxin-antitoxin system PIN domain toxin
MLIDVNLLLYAAVAGTPEHAQASDWLESQLNGDRRIGIPWESISGFLRLATNPRVVSPPLGSAQAWNIAAAWLEVANVWIPTPTDAHPQVFGDLLTRYRLSGKLVPDAHLAALAIEHGLDIYSTDTDFARFAEVRWINPLAASR